MPEEVKNTNGGGTATLEQVTDAVVAKLSPQLSTLMESAVEKALANAKTINVETKKKPAEAISDEELTIRRAVVPVGRCEFDKGDLADFKFSNLLIGKSTGDFRRYASLELDMCAYAARFESGNGLVPKGFSVITRDVASNPDPKGGFVIPAAVYAAGIEPALREEITLWQLGIKKYLNVKAAELKINRITGEPTAYDYAGSISDPTAVTASDMTFDQVSMRPRSAAARTKIDMDMISDASLAVEDMVREAIASQIGQKVEFNGYQGPGTSAAPQGIFDSDDLETFNWAASGSAALDGALAFDKLSQHIHKLRLKKTLKGKSLAWALPAAAEHALRTMKDPTDNSQPKTRRVLSEKNDVTMLMGYPFVSSTNVPDNKIMFGDWSKFAYAQWGGMFMVLDSLTSTGVFQMQVLSRIRYDWACIQEKAFCQSTNLTGAP